MKPLLIASQVGVGRAHRSRLDAVDVAVCGGDRLAILGTNGAGKTTLIRLLAGVEAPDRGEVRLDATRLQRAAPSARRRIGYLPQRAPAYPDLTVDENLAWAGRLQGLRGAGLRDAVTRARRDFDLERFRERLAGQLSAGTLQRLGLAQAMLHAPDIVILDEPTAGLDPVQADQVRGLLAAHTRARAMVLSTHVLEDVQSLCNRVILLADGRKRDDRPVSKELDLMGLFREPAAHPPGTGT
jgi:ABC-2 type transport system ATP-binding protein